MRWIRRILNLARSSWVPRATRWDMFTLAVRRRLSPRAEYSLRTPVATLSVDHLGAPIDVATLNEVWLDRCFDTEYSGRVVVDLGGHRGFYGAYALLQGAKHVYSYEPEPRNFAALTRACDDALARGYSWSAFECAVADVDTTAQLFVMDKSWSHSTHDRGRDGVTSVIDVPQRSFAGVMDDVRREHPGDPIVVKINIEGAECEVILGSPDEAWTGVETVLYTVDDPDCCGRPALMGRLTRLHFGDHDEIGVNVYRASLAGHAQGAAAR